MAFTKLIEFKKQAFHAMLSWFDKHERLTITVLALIVGVIGGYASIALRILIESVGSFHLTADYSMVENLANRDFIWRLLPPLAGLTAVVILIKSFAPETRGSGIPPVMEAVAVHRAVIRPRVALIKTLATGLTLGAGGSGGSEGPVVQIGAAAGSSVGQFSHATYRRLRILLASGAAAALAAQFNAPIAAVLFAIEILVDEYSAMTLSPVIIASVIGTAVNHAHFGNNAAIVVPEALRNFSMVSGWELLTFTALGLLCGALSVLFGKVVFAVDDFFQHLKWPFWLESFLGALTVAIMVALVPNVAGVGYETIDSLLRENMDTIFLHDSLNEFIGDLWLLLVFLFVMKMVATAITLGIGASAGIFGPSLFLGAITGYFFGMFVNLVMPDVVSSPPAYALMGMGAFVAGATHTPMTSIVILFEMTGDYFIIVPDMLACIFATIVAVGMHKDSIFTRSLARRGIDVQQGKERQVLAGIRVDEVMDNTFQTIPRNAPYEQFTKMITYSRQLYFPVVDQEGLMIGILSMDNLKEHLFEQNLGNIVIAEDLVTRNVISIKADESLLTAFQKFNIKDVDSIPVVDPGNERNVVGMLSRRDLVGVYHRAVLKTTLEK